MINYKIIDIRNRFNELIKKDEIDKQKAIDFLKIVSSIYMEERGNLLHNKRQKDAKMINDEMAYIYYNIAKKIKDNNIRESLENFSEYWLRSGETEIFIESSLSYENSNHKRSNIHRITNHIESDMVGYDFNKICGTSFLDKYVPLPMTDKYAPLSLILSNYYSDIIKKSSAADEKLSIMRPKQYPQVVDDISVNPNENVGNISINPNENFLDSYFKNYGDVNEEKGQIRQEFLKSPVCDSIIQL